MREGEWKPLNIKEMKIVNRALREAAQGVDGAGSDGSNGSVDDGGGGGDVNGSDGGRGAVADQKRQPG
jgi:hypothetical protein